MSKQRRVLTGIFLLGTFLINSMYVGFISSSQQENLYKIVINQRVVKQYGYYTYNATRYNVTKNKLLLLLSSFLNCYIAFTIEY